MGGLRDARERLGRLQEKLDCTCASRNSLKCVHYPVLAQRSGLQGFVKIVKQKSNERKCGEANCMNRWLDVGLLMG